MHQECAVGDGADADTGHASQSTDYLLCVDAVARLDGDVALGPLACRLDEVDGANIAPGVADGRRDATEHPRAARDLPSNDAAVTRARRDHAAILPLSGMPAGRRGVARAATP